MPLTSITTRVFLGQQIQCTQCHDHPSNDWKQADFWGINAFFKGLKQEEVTKADATGAEVVDHTELTDEPTDAFASYDTRNGLVGIAFPTFLDGRKISQGTDVDRRDELGKFITDPKNDDLAKAFVNRMWGHFIGRGFVHPVDDFGPHNPPSHPELLDKLAEEFQASELRRQGPDPLDHEQPGVPPDERDDQGEREGRDALQPHDAEADDARAALRLAPDGHRGPQGGRRRRRRPASATTWLSQFVFAFANDEGEEASSFQGTIPQALMMMNGELMEQAVGGKPGSFLADLLEQAQRQARAARRLHGQQPLPGRPEPLPDAARAATAARSSSTTTPTRSTSWKTCSGPC